MQIFVATNTATTAYAVDQSTSVDALKAMIENKEFLPSNLIRLVNGANALEGGTLLGNGVQDEDTLSLVLEVPGGMRGKWRKKRMRRLRRKRRKMRQRAR
jgi:small subunit ribosomal protein S27Ae